MGLGRFRMGILAVLGKGDRKSWFVCYNCMLLTSHDAARSIFRYTGPPVDVFGRPVTPCPRCESGNTVSFQYLKETGAEAQLWGLEQVVKQHPRSTFEVKRQELKTPS
jgi:hypothetical protein